MRPTLRTVSDWFNTPLHFCPVMPRHLSPPASNWKLQFWLLSRRMSISATFWHCCQCGEYCPHWRILNQFSRAARWPQVGQNSLKPWQFCKGSEPHLHLCAIDSRFSTHFMALRSRMLLQRFRHQFPENIHAELVYPGAEIMFIL